MTRTVSKGGAKRLGNCVPEHLRGALSARLDEESRLRQAWHAVVPEPLASHTHPVRYAAGLLFVHVDTSAWASRLRHQQPALVAELRRLSMFRDLVNLRFRVTPRDSAAIEAETPKPAARSRLSSHAAKVIADAARSVSDPGLRDALQRLARSSATARAPKRRP